MRGAQGETRTHTVLLPGDFESPASTIPPLGPGCRSNLARGGRPEPIRFHLAVWRMNAKQAQALVAYSAGATG